MTSAREDTLYLPIKQTFFDQIVSGKKKEEYREVKFGITANRYLQHRLDANGNQVKDTNTVEGYVRNPKVTSAAVKRYWLDDYNDGNFPFMPKPFKYLHLAVGYSKVRDEAIVRVTDITFKPGKILGEGSKKFVWWMIVFHIGEVVRLERQKKHD